MYDSHLIYGVVELIHQLADQSKIDRVILYVNNLKHKAQLKKNCLLKKYLNNLT